MVNIESMIKILVRLEKCLPSPNYQSSVCHKPVISAQPHIVKGLSVCALHSWNNSSAPEWAQCVSFINDALYASLSCGEEDGTNSRIFVNQRARLMVFSRSNMEADGSSVRFTSYHSDIKGLKNATSEI